jgi:hypothetical protein
MVRNSSPVQGGEEGRRPLLPRLHPKLAAGVQGRLEQPSRVMEVAIASSADEHLRVVDLNAICRRRLSDRRGGSHRGACSSSECRCAADGES